jgi:hypothetical protein
MNDGELMGSLEGEAELLDEPYRGLKVERAAVCHPAAKVGANHELHHDVGCTVGRDSVIEDLGHVGAGHSRNQPSLERKPLDRALVGRRASRQELHRDLAVQSELLTRPYAPHAPLGDLVTKHDIAEHQSWRKNHISVPASRVPSR